jgi:hypothetical protein
MAPIIVLIDDVFTYISLLSFVRWMSTSAYANKRVVAVIILRGARVAFRFASKIADAHFLWFPQMTGTAWSSQFRSIRAKRTQAPLTDPSYDLVAI